MDRSLDLDSGDAKIRLFNSLALYVFMVGSGIALIMIALSCRLDLPHPTNSPLALELRLMASGKTHDVGILAIAPLIATSPLPVLPFVLGGLFLSPDLDCDSRPYYRWTLCIPVPAIKRHGIHWKATPINLWWPYKKIVPHRSVWSHGVLIGTAGRLAYLTFLLASAKWLGFTQPFDYLFSLPDSDLWGIAQAVELSALIHLFLDSKVWKFLGR